MKFSLNKKDISEILQHLLTIVPSKNNQLTVLNFKIEVNAETNIIKITATDFNVTSIVHLPANVVESGTILIPARHFSEIISALSDSVINFSIKEDHLFIECEKAKFSINIIEATFFPEDAVIHSEKTLYVKSEILKKMITGTTFCTASESVQQVYTGVFLKFDSSSLTIAATDTKRIAEASHLTSFDLENNYELVLPSKALNFVEKNLSFTNDLVEIRYDDKRISFNFDNILLITNRFEAKYPNYTVAFKNPATNFLTIDKNSLKDAVRRVSLLSEDIDKLIKMSINNDSFIIESIISEKGNAKESLHNFSYSGPELIFGINSRFLISIVNAIDTDEVVFQFRSSEEPIYIVNNKKSDELDIRYVLMPMRIEKR